MSPLASRAWRTARRLKLIAPGARVLVAVSGGADSVALLHIVREWAEEQPPSRRVVLAGLAHVNHGIRGAAADRDEQFCRALAGRLSVPVYAVRVDVPAAARAAGQSLEDAARVQRYEALERCRLAAEADVVAVGHTRDDQAETVLLQLARGTGTRGLVGIHPKAGTVVRPLLDVAGTELRQWLVGRGETWVEDESNADTSFRRNAVRLQMLPRLREAFGEGVSRVLARHAEIARADEELLGELTARALDRLAVADPAGVAIESAALAAEPLAIQRRVLLELLRRLGARDVAFDHVESLRAVVDGRAGRLELGRVRADRIGARVVLSSRAARGTGTPPFHYALPVPGEIVVSEAGLVVRAATEAWNGAAVPREAGQAVMDAAIASGGLSVRSWKPGDAMRPLGLGGRKKLQDLFTDRHVPREARAAVPLVVDARDRVLWVPGHALDEVCRVTEATTTVVILNVTELGGPS